jgi:dolichyl-phosphate beta-glucosyltransferase
MDRTVLVVPCYNEAERLPETAFHTFLAQDADVDLLFVDDGSTDRTAERLAALEAAAPGRVQVLRLGTNRGKGEAVRAGLEHAFAGAPTYVGYWDADLATPLSALAPMRDLLRVHRHVELILAARVQLLGRHIERRPIRHYAGRVFATAAALILRIPVYDTQCGAKLLRVTPRTREICRAPFLSPWLFDVELIARLCRSYDADRWSIHEIAIEYPLPAWRDVAGSKLRPRHLVRVAGDLARIAVHYRGRAPRREASSSPTTTASSHREASLPEVPASTTVHDPP